jgi:hypothetical protein
MSDNPISEIVAKYVDNDSVAEAIEVAEKQMFDELRKWPKGAPTYVMTIANLAAAEAMIQFLVHMSIDALANVHGWSEADTQEQELLAFGALRLIREDKMHDVVRVLRETHGNGTSTA